MVDGKLYIILLIHSKFQTIYRLSIKILHSETWCTMKIFIGSNTCMNKLTSNILTSYCCFTYLITKKTNILLYNCIDMLWYFSMLLTNIARFMRPIWGPAGACRPQVGPMLAPSALLSGDIYMMMLSWHCGPHIMMINSSPPGQNGGHFAEDIFKCIFMVENVRFSIQISLKFVPKGSIDN